MAIYKQFFKKYKNLPATGYVCKSAEHDYNCLHQEPNYNKSYHCQFLEYNTC